MTTSTDGTTNWGKVIIWAIALILGLPLLVYLVVTFGFGVFFIAVINAVRTTALDPAMIETIILMFC